MILAESLCCMFLSDLNSLRAPAQHRGSLRHLSKSYSSAPSTGQYWVGLEKNTKRIPTDHPFPMKLLSVEGVKSCFFSPKKHSANVSQVRYPSDINPSRFHGHPPRPLCLVVSLPTLQSPDVAEGQRVSVRKSRTEKGSQTNFPEKQGVQTSPNEWLTTMANTFFGVDAMAAMFQASVMSFS